MKNEKGNSLFHKLDRWVGIPLVFLLGGLRKKNTKPIGDINNFAILNLGSIGDNVLMSAIIADLRSQYPAAKITAFTGTSNYQMVKLIDGIDTTHKLSVTNVWASYKFIKASGSFDVLIDFGPWPRINSIFSSFFTANYKIGYNSKGQYRHYVYDIEIEHSSEIHEINNFRNLIKGIYNGTDHDQSIKVIPTEKSIKIAEQLGNYCIIHPWPGGYKSYMKEWPSAKWIELLKLIADDFDHIIITGAPMDIEKSKSLERIADPFFLNGKVKSIAGELNLAETTYILSAATAVFSVNTGIAHMAAALNKSQVCLHGPTNVIRWAPYSNKTVSVTPDSGKFGYLNFGFEYDRADGDCMENLSVETVYKAYQSLNINHKKD